MALCGASDGRAQICILNFACKNDTAAATCQEKSLDKGLFDYQSGLKQSLDEAKKGLDEEIVSLLLRGQISRRLYKG
jgi:hypothetical protein